MSLTARVGYGYRMGNIMEQMTKVENTDIMNYILNTDRTNISYEVYQAPDIPVKREAVALAMSRRTFKRNKAFIIAFLDDEYDGKEGIAFTDTGIVHWDEDSRNLIEYSNIDTVDFDENNVELITKDERKYIINCGDTSEEYEFSLNLYNLIMDCLEY